MKRLVGGRLLLTAAVMLVGAGTWVWARSGATVPRSPVAILKIDTNHPGSAFERGAVGLSIDANELASGHLSANDHILVQLMHLLGPSVLRIGGSSVDRSWWTAHGKHAPSWATNIVTPADLTRLRGLLDATGWRALLGVDLGHFEPSRAGEEGSVARQILGSRLAGIEIGNEPNFYTTAISKVERPSSYGVGEYLREASAYRQALTAAAPGLAIDGPAVSQIGWLSQLGASAALFTQITQHYYPSDSCSGTLPADAVSLPTATEVLSASERQQENETLNVLAQVSTLAGRPTIISETGTGPCGGRSFSSPTFASALWSLDWTLRAVSAGVTGVDFHGHFGVCGPHNQSPICAKTAGAARGGRVGPQPEYYGMLAASRLEGGRFVPTNLISPTAPADLTTWATAARGRIVVSIDNVAGSGPAQPLWIAAPRGYSATEEPLTAPSAEATSGVTLGGAAVTPIGRWRPRPIKLARRGRYFRVVVAPTSAIVVTLRRAPARR
jgi:hypothetical protein